MDIKRNRSTDSIDSEEERDVFDSNETEQQLYTEVRDILSKLTSKNFQKYLTIVRSLKINSCEKLHGIVNILFEEIINYESCALLCRELVLMPMLKCEELKKKFGLKFTTFRMLLYIRCEVELKKIFNEDQYLINLMYNDVYYISENEKEFQNEGKYFDKQLHETSITFIKFLGELYKQFVITNDILIKFMVNVFDEFDNVDQKCFRCLRYLLSAIGEELRKDFINSFYGRWKTVCRQTLESKVIEQRTDDKHVPEESEQSIFERNMYYKSRTLTSYSSVFKEVQENIRIKLENKERKVYTLENLLLLRNVPNSTKLPENYIFILSLNLNAVPHKSKETSICRLMDQTDIQDTFSTSPPAPYQIAIQNNTTIVIPEQQSLRKRQRSKQLTIDPNADACTDSVKTAVHNIVSSLHEIISPDNTATVILPHKSKLKQKRILIIDPDTGRKMYKLVEKHDENKSEPKSKQSSACQPVQSLVLEKSAITKEELHKIVNKTITKLTSSSLKSTVNTIASLKVNTYESVKYVIEIIMERAMNKSESCALLCKELDQMLVPTMGEFKNRKKLIIFRELLVARCVEDLYDVPSFTEEENPANELVVSLRLKHVGLVKFMRELHKNQMLTDAVVVDCIVHLLKTWRTNSEGNIECVCRLLLMFGEELEIRKVDLRSYFNTLKQICNNNQKKLSNLLRLISQSLLDLWIAKWSPEKQEICQILQNAYNPRITITELHGIIFSFLKKQKVKQIKMLKIDTYEQLKAVVKIIFSKVPVYPEFCFQLCVELLPVKVPYVKNDSFEIVDIRKVLRNKFEEKMGIPDFTTFIGHLFEKELITSDIVVKWVAKLLTNANENSLVSVHKLLVQVGERLEKKGIDLSPHYNRINRIIKKKHEKINSSVLRRLNDLITRRNAKLSVKQIQPQQFQTITNQPNNNVQHKLLEVFQKLALSNNLSEITSQNETVPQQIKVITKKGIQTVQTKDVSAVSDHSVQQMHEKELLGDKKKLKGTMGISQKASLKHKNNISLSYHSQNDKQLPSTSKIMTLPNSEVCNEMKLDDVSNSTMSFKEVHKKLRKLFSVNTSINEVIEWIQTNVGEAKEEEVFVTALMTAILQQCIVKNKLNDQKFKNFYQCIHRLYIGSSDSVEIYCLYAVQTLFYKMGFPEDLLLTTFRRLYEDSIILPESFLTWKACTDPTKQAGKGDALKQLTDFFAELKTNEYEDM